MSQTPTSIVVTEEPIDVPVAELMTGRGFVTGKSGSGKSNSASVIAEELLELGLPIMIVDTDGEYYGLQERYQILHATPDDEGDMEVGVEDATQLAELALDGNVPVVLDLSSFVDPDEGEELIRAVLRELFRLEDDRRQPFLLIVEEIHEYLPEQGAHSQLGDLLIQIAKRGRKRGLGLCGISQRPAAVDKDFITQCDWLVWHRLTWENDTRVVKQILGSDAASTVRDLKDGEAILMTDWDDTTRRVRFRKKRTHDAGATPDLSDVTGGPAADLEVEVLEAIETEELANPNDPTAADLDRKQRRIDRLQQRINELEDELELARAAPDPPPEPIPHGEPPGPIAQGLSELGSLAAYTTRVTRYRIAVFATSLKRRLAKITR